MPMFLFQPVNYNEYRINGNKIACGKGVSTFYKEF